MDYRPNRTQIDLNSLFINSHVINNIKLNFDVAIYNYNTHDQKKYKHHNDNYDVPNYFNSL